MSKRTTTERKRGAEVKRLRKRLKWTWVTLAAFLEVSESTVARWESGRVKMPTATRLLLEREVTGRKGLAKRPSKRKAR